MIDFSIEPICSNSLDYFFRYGRRTFVCENVLTWSNRTWRKCFSCRLSVPVTHFFFLRRRNLIAGICWLHASRSSVIKALPEIPFLVGSKYRCSNNSCRQCNIKVPTDTMTIPVVWHGRIPFIFPRNVSRLSDLFTPTFSEACEISFFFLICFFFRTILAAI